MADGSFDVSEVVRLRTAVSSVLLSPPRIAAAGAAFAALRPIIESVQLTVGGRPVPLAQETVIRTREVQLPSPTTTMELRYVVRGTVVRSVPSTSGRALAAVMPLVVSGEAGAVVVRTSSQAVLNITCPLLSGTAQLCSSGPAGSRELRSPLPPDKALIMFQLDLPRP